MKLRICILISFLVFASKTEAQHYFFRQYTNTEGLLHSFVYDINQDKNGYLWIGTPDGLYRFDGFDFKHFTIADNLGDNFVTKIFKDSNGGIWIGHQNGSVSHRLNKGFSKLNEEKDGLGPVTDIVEDDMGTIWILNQLRGISIVKKDRIIKTVDFPDLRESVSQMEYAGAGQFIIGTQESLYLALYDRDQSSMEIVQKFESYPGSRVVEIIKDANVGYVIVSQNDGIYYLNSDSIRGGFLLSTIDGNADGLIDNLQGGLMDGNGDLWFCSLGNGVIQYRSVKDHFYFRSSRLSTENGLVSMNARSMFEDAEGNLWIGMYGEGLVKYVDSNLNYFQFNDENDSNETRSIAGYDDDLLVVAGKHLLRINQSGDSVLNVHPLPVDRAGDRVNTVYVANDSTVWLGYEQSGLFASGSSYHQFSRVFISYDELSNSINHITGDDDYIWVATKKGICRISRSTNELRWFTTNDGLPHNNIRQLFIDSAERVLIATLSNEIYCIVNDSDVGILEHSGLGPHTSVVSFAEDSQGRLWAATLGNGIWMIRDDTVLNYNQASGLFSDFCYSLALTKNGEPIIGHTGGISLIDPETDRFKLFGLLDGVKSSTEFFPNAIFTDLSGNIWFGTSEGVIQYTPGTSKGGRIPPMLQINAVLINGDTIDHTKGSVSLKPGQYELEVDFVGISFTNPEMVYYKTKLEGYNNDWSAPGFGRKVVYDRIGHGNYAFRISAYNENNIKSELSPAFKLKIKKPVYLTIWFYGIILVLIGFVFYLILRIRERNHRMVQERLLKNLDEKTKEIIVKEEIIKERKKVENVLIEAKTKAEMSEKLKTAFLQNISHEIRTPMNAIVGFTQLLSMEGLTAESRDEFIRMVSKNSQSLLKLVDDILDLSKLETNQLEISIEKTEVNALIRDVELPFRKRLSTGNKEGIEFITGCPDKEEVWIATDETRLKQILNNLLDNALKFTEKGRIILGYSLKENTIEFFVEDTGIGLSEDKKGVVFDLFRKVEDDRFKLYGGTGMGLTLAKYLVELMGGKIDVVSTPGAGSRFHFYLPLNPG